VRLGLHFVAGDLAGTLRALHEATLMPFELVILADPGPGDEAAAQAALAALAHIPLCAVPPPGGAPAAFNQLLASPADIYVFLEAGTRPAPGWLEWLLEALDADPAHGLAGPSTNLCWNAQAVAPAGPATSEALRRQAQALWQEKGRAFRSMAPLNQLAH
jgi:hypothetical protein